MIRCWYCFWLFRPSLKGSPSNVRFMISSNWRGGSRIAFLIIRLSPSEVVPTRLQRPPAPWQGRVLPCAQLFGWQAAVDRLCLVWREAPDRDLRRAPGFLRAADSWRPPQAPGSPCIPQALCAMLAPAASGLCSHVTSQEQCQTLTNGSSLGGFFYGHCSLV
jgi:hypothetical protein